MELYNNNESNIDPNEALGQKLFLWAYIVTTVIAYRFGIFLYQLLFEVYDSEVGRDKDFPFPAQFLTVTFLASVYIGALYVTDIIYYCYNWNNLNVFIGLKMVVMTIPVMVYILFIAVKYDILTCTCMSNTKAPCLRRLSPLNMIFSREFLVGLLTLAIMLLILSIFPTLLLFFAHPMNTLALLVIHIALFYTETITNMLVIERLKLSRKREHTCNKGSFKEQAYKSKQYNKLLSMAHSTRENEEQKIDYRSYTYGVVLAIGVVIMINRLGIVYIIVMWFYQFVFLRNLNNNLALDIIIQYVPSIGIAAVGSLIQIWKSKKEDKNEKLWLKLGEPFNILGDYLNLLVVAKKEKIAKPKKLCRQALANHNQSDPT